MSVVIADTLESELILTAVPKRAEDILIVSKPFEAKHECIFSLSE